MDQSLLDRARTRRSEHPFHVDAALAVLVGLGTGVLPGLVGLFDSRAAAVVLSLVLAGALVWRRRRPLITGAVVASACLLQLVILPNDLLLADVAAPMTIYALAAYGPRWAGHAGLSIGLLGAALGTGRYYGGTRIEFVVILVEAVGLVVVAAWALGLRRRARVQTADAGWSADGTGRPVVEQLSAWLRRHLFGVDSVAAAGCVLVLVVAPGEGYGNVVTSSLVSLMLLVPLAWRRRRPVPAAAVIIAAGLLELALLPDEFLPANVAAPVMVYALAAYAPRWAGRAGLAAGLLAAALAAATSFDPGTVFEFLVVAAGIGVLVVASWALGDLRRARLQHVAGLEERARLLELEREQEMQLAASTERARIAREMHDVVAHSLSVVIAQADGGRYAGQADPAAAASALEQISTTGRQALAEMRKLLGVLREGGGQEFAPQPDVAAIDPLVADVRSSGLDVALVVEGEPQPMPAGPQLAAYRIVQESLTNVLKHAGPAGRAKVRLHWRLDALELSVEDDGRGAAAAIMAGDGQGLGLLGMRERAQLHGGRLTTAPRTGGGFGVEAVLPYRSSR